MDKNDKEYIPIILAIIILYRILHILGISCPIKFATGISCPGCGMTRAYLALLKLDFKKSFYYHPLFITPLLSVIIYFNKEKIPKNILNLLTYFFIALFFIIYIFRLITFGIYPLFWNYMLANRLASNGHRYGLYIQSNGNSVLLWTLLGPVTCGIGHFIALKIILDNLNKVSKAYNDYYRAS